MVNTANLLYIQVKSEQEKEEIAKSQITPVLEEGFIFYTVRSCIEMLRDQATHNGVELVFEHPQ